MAKRSQADQFNERVERLLQQPHPDQAASDFSPLLAVAQKLRDLPRASFRERLKSDLERKATMASMSETVAATRQTAAPILRFKNVAAAIEFYQKAFNAREIMRFETGGTIPHAEIAMGNSIVMLGHENQNYGYLAAETLGGSPVMMSLSVEDVDKLVAQASAAGARMVAPVQDHFYGERSGQVADPFGYVWSIGTQKEDLTLEEMHRRLAELERQQQAGRTARRFIPEGYRTVTPYLRAQNVPAVIGFLEKVFGAEEKFRTIGSAGGIHAELLLGDSMLMIGGGAPDLSIHTENQPMALHIYVEDTDAAYERALQAGGVSIDRPVDHEYGERGASVKDAAGNYWYIATHRGPKYIPEGLGAVTPYLHPLRAEPLIRFIERGLGGEEVAKYASPDGVIHHASVRIGDSVIEMGEAHGPYQPMPCTFYLYVPDADSLYRRALVAGATSTGEPADQTYGDRTAGVKDAFGNQWYLATHIRDVQH